MGRTPNVGDGVKFVDGDGKTHEARILAVHPAETREIELEDEARALPTDKGVRRVRKARRMSLASADEILPTDIDVRRQTIVPHPPSAEALGLEHDPEAYAESIAGDATPYEEVSVVRQRDVVLAQREITPARVDLAYAPDQGALDLKTARHKYGVRYKDDQTPDALGQLGNFWQ